MKRILQTVDGRWRQWLDVTTSLAVVAVAAVMIWTAVIGPNVEKPTTKAQPRVPDEPVSLDHAALKGNPNAKAVVIEYSDFECPYCAQVVRETFPVIDREFVQTGRVLLAYRHLPLTSIHPTAMKAAEAAECSRVQGKFWEMHDLLFTTPRAALQQFGQHAQAIGLNPVAFEACMSGAALSRVSQDIEQARSLGFPGTPTFLFGVRLANDMVRVTEARTGALSASVMKQILERLLRAN